MKRQLAFGLQQVLPGLGVLILAGTLSQGVSAHCKGRHGQDAECETHTHDSGGKDGTNDGNLEATFCLDIHSNSASELSMAPDDGSFNVYHYCDDRGQKVDILTGKGPGFAFQTNKKGASWIRSVKLNCTQDIVLTDNFGNTLTPLRCGESYLLSFRYDQDDGGLDLGSLDSSGGTGLVSIFAGLEDSSGRSWMFAHGSVASPGTSGHLAQNPCVAGTGSYAGLGATDDLLVTRKDADTWWFEHSGAVCLWDKDAGLEFQAGTRVYLDYTFKLDQE